MLRGKAAMYKDVLAASEFLGIVGASVFLCASRGLGLWQDSIWVCWLTANTC